jgi:hypothetical protein
MNRNPWQESCIVLLIFFIAGCASSRGVHRGAERDAFDVELMKGAKWRTETLHFDSRLPGYRLSGGIGTMKLSRRPGLDSNRLCLEIWTSPGMPPNLEAFTLTWGDTLIRASAFGESGLSEVVAKNADGRWKTVFQTATKRYFAFQKGDSSVTVCLLPAALGLIKKDCTISWIDWYR